MDRILDFRHVVLWVSVTLILQGNLADETVDLIAVVADPLDHGLMSLRQGGEGAVDNGAVS